jgi:hypothetical protein
MNPAIQIKLKPRSALAFALLWGALGESQAQFPSDFPQLSLQPSTNPAPGYLMGSLTVSNVANVSNYFAILDNNLNPILLSKTNTLGSLGTMASNEALLCNGQFVTTAPTPGQPVTFVLKDESFNVMGSYQAGNGYNADTHDFELLPNGHALIEIYDTTPVVDMSKLVPGGFPAAVPNQSVIQEVDLDGNVVWQWRSLDHIPVTDSYQTLTNANIGDYIHLNSLQFDDRDGNLIVSLRNTSEVIKISRVTGDILWRMMGKHNQFAFTNGIPGNTDPATFQVQHNAGRLPNGNLTIFDNGYSTHSDPSYNFLRPYSRAVEYVIDETNKTAELVWAYRHNPDIITYNQGTVERLPDGHSIIQWAAANSTEPALAMSEVDANANLVADLVTLQNGVSGNFTRIQWPIETNYVTLTIGSLSSPNQYVFSDNSAHNTGVTLALTSLDGQADGGGDAYNSVTVSRQPFAPVLPRFAARAPRVLPVRVEITGMSIFSLTSAISFDADTFGWTSPNALAITSPTNLTVYYRPVPGQGVFVPVPTDYNWVTHQLESSLTGFGEFIFGFPDLPAVPYPPLLASPQPGAAVNQNLPVAFFWTPTGFAASYHLQVATDPDFTTLVVDMSGLTQSLYRLPSVTPNTGYYWRVSTSNDGGVSDWATNSFTTIPPLVQMTVPQGGEAWQRGSSCILQWKDNLAENGALDLYQGGNLVQTLTTNAPTITAFRWKINANLVPGSDYSILIRSTTNAALFAASGTFSIIDQPTISATPVNVNPGGQPQQFGFSAPGAPSATLWGATNLAVPNWQNLGKLTVTGSNGVFTVTPPYNVYEISVP